MFTRCTLMIGACMAAMLGGEALGDFSGQPILGPLTVGSNVFGDLTGASDDNDGWYSGFPVFGIWDGGDDVYALNWVGGNLKITLTYDNFFCDPDLFLYTPGSLDESSYDSITNGTDEIVVNGAAAGTYYILIDTTAGMEGEYQLSVSAVPAPGAAMFLIAGMLGGRRRRNV